mmetsp:Transcript_22595/g.31875  ORF Transcript_22595/g.31875 Transcript_22595/m.31875 type:complete len:223 (-) Transcript_22595:495-1163(-)
MNTQVPGLEEVTSNEFPNDSIERVQRAHAALIQLNGTGLALLPGLSLVPGMTTQFSAPNSGTNNTQGVDPTTQISNAAEEAINAAFGAPSSFGQAAPSSEINMLNQASPVPAGHSQIDDSKKVGGSDSPTRLILVHNMFDKDEETEEGWEQDIKEDFEDECVKHGKISYVKVMSEDIGGKIYACFEAVESAKACAENLAGRWFDKRQLRVEFIREDEVSKIV